MSLSKEDLNKLFFKNLNRFIIEDPLNGGVPDYDIEGNLHIIYYVGNNKYNYCKGQTIKVQLESFDSYKDYENVFINGIKECIVKTNNIHNVEKQNLNSFLTDIYNYEPELYLNALLCNSENFILVNDTKQYITTINNKLNSNYIFCFTDHEYTGVCPINNKNELGLMLIADHIHAINVIENDSLIDRGGFKYL
jgi:hypothetical protein